MSGALRIIAQHGFGQEFPDHFAVVDDDRSACGRAAMHGAQLVITDVIVDQAFEPHREVAAASGFRASRQRQAREAEHRALALHINADLVTFSHSTHNPMVEEAGKFNALLRDTWRQAQDE